MRLFEIIGTGFRQVEQKRSVNRNELPHAFEDGLARAEALASERLALLTATQEGLARAEALAIERLALVEETTRRAERAEAALAAASARTLEVLAEVGPKLDRERDHAASASAQAQKAERRAAELEARLKEAEARIAGIEGSTTWRLAARVHPYFLARPRLAGVLRRALSLVVRRARATRNRVQKAQV
jgi:hypothetical protein